MTSFLFCKLLANVVTLSEISTWQSEFDVGRSATTPRRDCAISIDAGNSSMVVYKLTVCGLVLLSERSNSCRSPINRKELIDCKHVSYSYIRGVQSASDLTIYTMAIGYQKITSYIHWFTSPTITIIGSNK